MSACPDHLHCSGEHRDRRFRVAQPEAEPDWPIVCKEDGDCTLRHSNHRMHYDAITKRSWTNEAYDPHNVSRAEP